MKTDEQKKVLSEFTILCCTSFTAILGLMWPLAAGRTPCPGGSFLFPGTRGCRGCPAPSGGTAQCGREAAIAEWLLAFESYAQSTALDKVPALGRPRG